MGLRGILLDPHDLHPERRFVRESFIGRIMCKRYSNMTVTPQTRLIVFVTVIVFALAPWRRTKRAKQSALDQRVRAECRSSKARVAIFAKNLETGETYELSADERVPTASTIKIAVMIEAFARVAEGKQSGRIS